MVSGSVRGTRVPRSRPDGRPLPHRPAGVAPFGTRSGTSLTLTNHVEELSYTTLHISKHLATGEPDDLDTMRLKPPILRRVAPALLPRLVEVVPVQFDGYRTAP